MIGKGEAGTATRRAQDLVSRIECKGEGEERCDLPLIDIHRTQL